MRFVWPFLRTAFDDDEILSALEGDDGRLFAADEEVAVFLRRDSICILDLFVISVKLGKDGERFSLDECCGRKCIGSMTADVPALESEDFLEFFIFFFFDGNEVDPSLLGVARFPL